MGIILFSIFLAEVAGYFVHRAMHSKLFSWMSAGHMTHHEELYHPDKPQVTAEYVAPGGTVLEWLLPLLGLALLWNVILWYWAGFGAVLLSDVTLATYSWFAFQWVHKQFHVPSLLDGFVWFERRRELHLYHHERRTSNYGILWYGLDRLLGTYTAE